MKYLRVRWLHAFSDEPVVLYAEIDEDGYETRKVDEYRDGRLDVADERTETGSTRLSELPCPPLEEINADEEFDGHEIEAREFEDVWHRAWEWFHSP